MGSWTAASLALLALTAMVRLAMTDLCRRSLGLQRRLTLGIFL